MPDRDDQPEDFGRVETPSGMPHAMRLRASMALLDRRFQFNVLILFVVSVLGTVLLDGAYKYLFHDTVLDAVLRAVVPVFTFVLGIGIKIERD